MASNPHDGLFKSCFGQPELARGELEIVLPSEIGEHLELGSLEVRPGSFVDEALQQTHSDVLYAVRTNTGGEGLVYVLFEHQSSQDGRMAFRVLVQLALWTSRSFPRLRDAAPFMRALIDTLARDERTRLLFTQLLKYVLATAPQEVEPTAIRAILLEIAGPERQEDIVNAGEQLIEQGRLEGLAQGQLEGLRTAVSTALAARSLNLSQMGRARLAACTDVATLTQWLTRAVTAASEAEVFAPLAQE